MPPMSTQPPPVSPPVGPEVDTTPRPLPVRSRITGRTVELEPLHPRHAPELWQAVKAGTDAGDNSWAYMGYGPFASRTLWPSSSPISPPPTTPSPGPSAPSAPASPPAGSR
jgi:hypothetical protein